MQPVLFFSIIGSLIVVLFLATPVKAGELLTTEWLDDWDTLDKVLLGGAAVVCFLDWGQTRDIVRSQDSGRTSPVYYEANPILGEEPTMFEVDLFFVGTYAFHVFISNQLGNLPTWKGIDFGSIARKVWLFGWMAIQYGFVVHNENSGLRASFNLFTF